MQTGYNKISCRSCGGKLLVTRTCRHCGEPVVWFCASCFAMYDCVHAHTKQEKIASPDSVAIAE